MQMSHDFQKYVILACECNADGRVGEDICNAETGVCDCKENVIGDKCDVCKTGHYRFPECLGNSYFNLKMTNIMGIV